MSQPEIGDFTRAVETNDTEAAERLLADHPTLVEDAGLTIDGYLKRAVRRDNVEMLEFLVARGADIHKWINSADVLARYAPEQARAATVAYGDDANRAGHLAAVFYKLFGRQ
jgi:hypothetical protein